jgi:hypothetical protein
MASGPERNGSFYRQDLENLIEHYEKCLRKFGGCVEKQGTNVETYLCSFLISTYLHLKSCLGGSVIMKVDFIYE